MKRMLALLLVIMMFTLSACCICVPSDNGIDYKESNALSEANYIKLKALALAVEYPNGDPMPLSSGEDSTYQPVMKTYNRFIQKAPIKTLNDKVYYEVRVNACLEEGFRDIDITQEEFAQIKAWEEENGMNVLFPLVDYNQFSFNDDPNIWYRVSISGKNKTMPLDKNGKIMDYSEDMVLVENYVRDEQGNPVYYRLTGGGTAETARYRVRVLFYNYFQYKNGRKPTYPKDLTSDSLRQLFGS